MLQQQRNEEVRLSGTAVWFRALLCLIALLALGTPSLRADDQAYAGLGSGGFGTIDLNTGVFTPLGNLGQTPAGLAVAGGTLFATSFGNGTLYQVNPANGSLTQIGAPSGIFYSGGFGSTLSGLYAVGGSADLELYSIDASTGAATPIGLTGISLGPWRDLSVNSATLYYGNGADLYTLNTATGLATLVGAFGNGALIGAMVTQGGILYGGDQGNGTIDTINPITGAATPIPGGSTVSDIWGLAAVPPSSTPEPGDFVLFGSGVLGLAEVLRRRRLV
jgi:hypothetical protein